MTTLRIVSLFNKDLRGLLQVAPDYMKPVRYDARKLQGLLGPQQMNLLRCRYRSDPYLDRIGPVTKA
jgi:hypothetical protein